MEYSIQLLMTINAYHNYLHVSIIIQNLIKAFRVYNNNCVLTRFFYFQLSVGTYVKIFKINTCRY